MKVAKAKGRFAASSPSSTAVRRHTSSRRCTAASTAPSRSPSSSVSAAPRCTAPSNANASKPEQASRRRHPGADAGSQRRPPKYNTRAGRRRPTKPAWVGAPSRVPRRNRPADPAPRPLLPHAVARRPSAARRQRPGPPGRRPRQLDQRARPVRVLQPRQTSGRLALPDPTRTTTRDGDHHPGRPHLPIPSPRNLPRNASTGHDRLGLVFGALLRFAA